MICRGGTNRVTRNRPHGIASMCVRVSPFSESRAFARHSPPWSRRAALWPRKCASFALANANDACATPRGRGSEKKTQPARDARAEVIFASAKCVSWEFEAVTRRKLYTGRR